MCDDLPGSGSTVLSDPFLAFCMVAMHAPGCTPPGLEESNGSRGYKFRAISLAAVKQHIFPNSTTVCESLSHVLLAL